MADLLKVATIPGLEPEEQPVTREVDVPISVRGNLSNTTLGQLGSQVQITTTAHEFANSLRRVCANCKNFNQAKAQQIFAEKDLTADGQIELDNLKANLLSMSGGELQDMGFCHALSEITQDDVIVHPLGSCPTERYGDNFKPLDRSAAKRGDAGYDDIMKRAEGTKT